MIFNELFMYRILFQMIHKMLQPKHTISMTHIAFLSEKSFRFWYYLSFIQAWFVFQMIYFKIICSSQFEFLLNIFMSNLKWNVLQKCRTKFLIWTLMVIHLLHRPLFTSSIKINSKPNKKIFFGVLYNFF